MEKPNISQWLILTIHVYLFHLLLTPLLYFVINHNLVGLTWGSTKVPGGECHSMHLGSPFLTPQKVDEHVHYSIHTLSKGLHSMYQAHVHGFPLKKHDIIRASCDDVLMTVGCLGWWYLCQYWRGIKEECTRGGLPGLISQSKDPHLKCTSVHPSTGFARNIYKRGKSYV